MSALPQIESLSRRLNICLGVVLPHSHDRLRRFSSLSHPDSFCGFCFLFVLANADWLAAFCSIYDEQRRVREEKKEREVKAFVFISLSLSGAHQQTDREHRPGQPHADLPDRTFHSSGASKYAFRQTLCTSETSMDGF